MEHVAPDAVIRSLIETVWHRRDLDRLAEFWATDCANHAAPTGMEHGLEALKQVHEGTLAASSDLRVEVVDQAVDGEKVGTFMVTRGTHDGPLPGLPATGRRFEVKSLRIDRLVDGKIAEHWSVMDLDSLLPQLVGPV